MKLILTIGPPCSGKSTLSKLMESDGFVRVSQDDHGRKKHFTKFKDLLLDKKDIIVDRMNFDVQQREKFTKLAREFRYTIIFIEFKIPYETLKERFLKRKNHPTLTTLEDFEKVYKFYLENYEEPIYTEYDTHEVLEG